VSEHSGIFHTFRNGGQVRSSHACKGNVVVFNFDMVMFAPNAVYEAGDLLIMREREENEDIFLLLRWCFSHD